MMEQRVVNIDIPSQPWIPRSQVQVVLGLILYGGERPVSIAKIESLVRRGDLSEKILPPDNPARKKKWGRHFIERESLVKLVSSPELKSRAKEVESGSGQDS